MQDSYGIHWFRRDLRVAGNRALHKNWQQNKGRVVGVFCFDKKFLGRADFSVNRFHLFLKRLEALREELVQIGSDLLFMDIGPQAAFPELLQKLQANKRAKPTLITWGKDYEPFARKRDHEMSQYFQEQNIACCSLRDHLLLEPHEVSKQNSEEPYQVYSPFARQWLKKFEEDEVQKRVLYHKSGFQYLDKLNNNQLEAFFKLNWDELLGKQNNYKGNFKHYLQENEKNVDIDIPDVTSQAILKNLNEFSEHIDNYGDKRDVPSILGTSRFSLFLKNGSLTIPQIIYFYRLKAYKKKKSGRDTFLSELIWREFYYHILYHHPRVEQESFLPEYRQLKWGNNEDWFQAWKEGRTGFPIVDAGMRELNKTGWMHNRVRMIVASFLTKDLLIDWRWGERYFMEKLLDGDLAPNNGGWQWSASTGCDPQPYFRIFNPWLQSKRFDPEAVYIKRYLPELADLKPEELHKPVKGLTEYPEPIVDHHDQRDKALKMYKVAKGS